MFFFKKKSSTRYVSSMPRWMKWGLLIFVIGAFLLSSQTPQGVRSNWDITVDALHKQLPEKQEYTRFLPDMQGITTEMLREGSGAAVLCGQELLVEYAAQPAREADSYAMQPAKQGQLSLRLLPQAASPPVLHMLGAMKPGESRRLSMNEPVDIATLLGPDVGSFMSPSVDVTLVSVSPDMQALLAEKTPKTPGQAEQLGLKLFDEEIGQGSPAQCGQRVGVVYRLFDMRGRVAAQGERAFVIGQSEVILGMEQGVMGMLPGGRRLLVLPADWQRPLMPATAGQMPAGFAPRSGGQLMLLEMRLQRAVEPAKKATPEKAQKE